MVDCDQMCRGQREVGKVNSLVYAWFLLRLARGGAVTKHILREKARLFNTRLGGPVQFQAGDIWMRDFFKKYNINKSRERGQILLRPANPPSERFVDYQTSDSDEDSDSDYLAESKSAHSCRSCNFKFSRRDALKNHLRAVQTFDCKNEGVHYDMEHLILEHINALPKYKCPHCPVTFRKAVQMERHALMLHHPGLIVPGGQGLDPYVCLACQARFATAAERDSHILCHGENPFQCPRCPNEKFQLSRSFTRHVAREHPGDAVFTCRHCNKIFSSCTRLYRHHRVHSRPHQCHRCPAIFSSRIRLHDHLADHMDLLPLDRMHQLAVTIEAFAKTSQ